MKFDRIIRTSEIDLYKNDIAKVIANAKDGVLHFLIETPQKRRSTGPYSQNSHLHGHCQQIAVETGNDLVTIKDYVKSKAVSQGYPQKWEKNHFVNDLWGNPVGKPSSEATTSECAILIEVAHQVAAELGIILKETGIDENFTY